MGAYNNFASLSHDIQLNTIKIITLNLLKSNKSDETMSEDCGYQVLYWGYNTVEAMLPFLLGRKVIDWSDILYRKYVGREDPRL